MKATARTRPPCPRRVFDEFPRGDVPDADRVVVAAGGQELAVGGEAGCADAGRMPVQNGDFARESGLRPWPHSVIERAGPVQRSRSREPYLGPTGSRACRSRPRQQSRKAGPARRAADGRGRVPRYHRRAQRPPCRPAPHGRGTSPAARRCRHPRRWPNRPARR